jgi:hypothetical protein
MGGKNEFIHIRADDELKAALKQAAQRADRKDSDQARHLLRLALGLITEDEDRAVQERIKQHRDHEKKTQVGRPQSA